MIIETLPYSYAFLCANIELNNLNNVLAYNFSIWSEESILPMYIENDLIGYSTILEKWRRNKHIRTIYVRAMTLGNMVKQGLIAFNIDIAKVDIEGAEHHFLKRSSQKLRERIYSVYGVRTA